MESRVNTQVYRQRRERPDLLGERSPEGLRVTQISADAERPHSHIYMEARVFTPDSRRFVFQRFLDPADVDTRSSRREYLLCDIEDGYSFIQLTDEEGAIGPSVSPDGRFMYYFIDRTRAGGGWWAIKRVDLDTLQRDTLAKFDGPLPEAGRHLSLLYGTSSISSDGARLCMAGYLGDGRTHNAPWGLVVFDVERAAASLVFEGQSFCNIHHQYSRSKDPEESHDILLQDNHGCDVDELGNIVTLAGGKGADVHVIRDDGSDFRCYAFGPRRGRDVPGAPGVAGRADVGGGERVHRGRGTVSAAGGHAGACRTGDHAPRTPDSGRHPQPHQPLDGARGLLPLRLRPERHQVRLRHLRLPRPPRGLRDLRRRAAGRTRRGAADELPAPPALLVRPLAAHPPASVSSRRTATWCCSTPTSRDCRRSTPSKASSIP